MMMRPGYLMFAAFCACLAAWPSRGEDPGVEIGAGLVTDCGLPGGVCIVVGGPDAQIPVSIAGHAKFVVHILLRDDARLGTLREEIHRGGQYGRVSADLFDGRHLPYADNLVNVVVIDEPSDDLNLGEIQRTLAPLGIVYRRDRGRGDDAFQRRATAAGLRPSGAVTTGDASYLKAAKPWPETIDQWSHHLHAADGNPVANDTVVGPPEHYQWLAGPRWAQSHETDSNVRCLVTARGRLYYIVNEAPTSLAGPQSPPDCWVLTARDAFNGVRLWKRPVQPWGWREWKPSWFTPRPGVIPLNLDKRVVAFGDKLYVTLGYRAPVSELDGRSGKLLQSYQGTDHTSEILCHDGQLLLTVLKEDRAVVKRVDAESGQLRWTSEKDYVGTTTDYYRFTAMGGSVEPAKVAPTLDIATDGNVVGLLDGDSVVCLDFDTGHERWRTPFPLVKDDFAAGRIAAHQKVWTGTMIVSDGVILHASPHQLAGLSADTGEVLWQQPKKYLQHLWYEWKDVFLIDGLVWTWSDQLAREPLEGDRRASSWPVSICGYDLHSGQLKREVPLGNIFKTHHHHRCYRNKATTRFVLASRRGTEFVDLVDGHHTVHNWVRGTCHMGMVPANGLQYAPPHPCQCYLDEKLNGLNALAPARPSQSVEEEIAPAHRLSRGPAFGSGGSDELVAKADDWPTFRADATRSGSVETQLPAENQLLWQTELGDRVAPPICVGQQVFVPVVDQHQLVALDAASGRVQWRFTTGARIDSPPSYDRGALLFGSTDGSVYRVRASDGSLVWRFRAAPRDLRIGAFGQLESAWPVHGSVLVDDDPDTGTRMAYFAAGRSSHLDGGLRLFAIDAMTGEVKHERTVTGPSYSVDNIKQNYQLPMGLLPDIFRVEGSDLFMRATKFDRQLYQLQGEPKLKIRGGFSDDAYFKRMPWSIAGSGHARLIVNDETHGYCLRMFDSLQALSPDIYFTAGKDGYLLFSHDLGGGTNAWSQRVPIRGRAMVATAGQLCVAGPPDVIDADDPLAAFEGRKGGVLRIVDKADGKTISEHRLSMPPVFNGAAAAGGRLLLALEDGSVACFGEPR